MSSLLCVSIMVDSLESALSDARAARLAGAEMVEYRIDHLFAGERDDPGIRSVETLCRQTPLPCIITCRPTSEGGFYDGDDASRISLFEHLATLDFPPRYLDVEHSTLRRSANLRQKVLLAVEHNNQVRDLSTSLILSTHDFKSRPSNLFSLVREMQSEQAAKILKFAWHARSVRDNLELLDLLRERDRPMIALGMGEFGLMSRVLAPKFGGYLTFASLRDSSVTAPGQPTIAELLNLYRFRSTNPETRLFGVVGWPVVQSISPHVHNAGFESVSFNGVYLPIPIPKDWEHFKATVLAMLDHSHLDFRGCSVTIPHKEHLVRLARSDASRTWLVDELAARAQSANTLTVLNDESIQIANSDIPAIAAPLDAMIGADWSGVRVAVLGAGGVARAAALASVDRGACVQVFNRSIDRAKRLVSELVNSTSHPVSVEAVSFDHLAQLDADVIIQCTSVGMMGGPAADENPVPPQVLDRLKAGTIVFETVYRPVDTPLLRAAAERGLATIDGVTMFVHQAAEQFAGWTGVHPPFSLFERVARETVAMG